MMSFSVKACLFAMLCTVIGVIIKQIRPDFSPLVRIAGTVAVSSAALSLMLPMITYIRSLVDRVSLGEYGDIIIKALGVALLTQICADICRDSGEGSAAAGVELVGRIEILLLCFPILERLLSSVREVMSWG
jgi:stage III sporulation protein AD